MISYVNERRDKMKKILKNVIKGLIFIPNFPFYLPIAAYVAYNIYNNTGLVNTKTLEPENMVMDEIKMFIKDIYPLSVKLYVAISFYACMIIIFGI